MEHTEYVQVVSEEWRTDGGSGWVTPVVLVTGASPEFRAELLSRPERGGRHDPATDIIRFKKFSHMDVRFPYSIVGFGLKQMPISGDKLFHQVGLFLDARRAAEIGAHHQ